MKNASFLSRKEILGLLAYSSIFPITNLIGGSAMLIGIVATYPFLPLSWLGGTVLVSVIGNENVYLCGAFVTIFSQVWLLYVLYLFLRKHNNAQKT